ncbi:MAG: hypothetical protein ACR2O8_11220 [Rhizobiaceae bacterium]
MRRFKMIAILAALTAIISTEWGNRADSQDKITPASPTGAVAVKNQARPGLSAITMGDSLNPKCEPVDTKYKKFGVIERVRHASTKLINPQTADRTEFVQSFSLDDLTKLLWGKQNELMQLLADDKLAIGRVDGSRLVLDKCDARTLAAMIVRLKSAAKMGMVVKAPDQAHTVLVAKGYANNDLAAANVGNTWIAPYVTP